MKRFLTGLMCLVILLLSLLCGCTGGKKPIGNGQNDLEIFLWQAGYGREFFDAIIDAYTAKNPDVNISLTSSADLTNEPIYNTPETNTVDLYFTSFPTYASVVKYDSNSDGVKEDILEDLNGVLDMKADGETKTLREKFGSHILGAVTNSEGKIYSLPWYNSLCGLVYNSDMFEKYDWDLPRTTDELLYLADVIKLDKETPIIHYAEYWKYLYEAWVAQYEGISNYQDIWKGIYTDSNGEKHSNDVRFITESQGRYESYSVLSGLLGPKGSVYTGSNSFGHTTSQTYFLDGRAAMMPNGSWVENEMKSNSKQVNYGMMKTPVISSIIDVLPDESVDNDAELAALIDAIDAGNTALEGAGYSVTQDDYNRVKEARNLFYLSGQADVLLPAYSTAKEVAKDFLRFYFSDEAVQIAITKAGMLATVEKDSGEFDYSKNSKFVQDCHNKSKGSSILISSFVERLMYAGGITELVKNNPVKWLTYSANTADFMEVDAYWTMEKNAWINSWEQTLVNAGLQ